MSVENLMTGHSVEPKIHILRGQDRVSCSSANNIIDLFFPSNHGYISLDETRLDEIVEFFKTIIKTYSTHDTCAMTSGRYDGVGGIKSHNNIKRYSLEVFCDYYDTKYKFDFNNITREKLKEFTICKLQNILSNVQKEKEKRNEKSCCS